MGMYGEVFTPLSPWVGLQPNVIDTVEQMANGHNGRLKSTPQERNF